jgi:hypothetical protein
MQLRTAIRRWHWGKLVILWSWGGGLAALLLERFAASPVDDSPLFASAVFLISVTVLSCLTVITWIWLGGKDRPE